MVVELGELLYCSLHKRYLIVDDLHRSYNFLKLARLLPCHQCKWDDFYCSLCNKGNFRCCFCNNNPNEEYSVARIYFCDKHENYHVVEKCSLPVYKHLKKCLNNNCKNYYCSECSPNEELCFNCIVTSQLIN